MTTQQLTAADYAYIDKSTRLYTRAKAFIGECLRGLESDSDRDARWRPGIPGTIEALNRRVQNLVKTGEFETAAQLIERKVKKAYRL